MENKCFLTAQDVMEMLGVSLSYLSHSAMSLLIVFPLVSLMLPVEFNAILYGGSVKIRSIELVGIRDRRLRASSLNSLYLFVFVENMYPPFIFCGII